MSRLLLLLLCAFGGCEALVQQRPAGGIGEEPDTAGVIGESDCADGLDDDGDGDTDCDDADCSGAEDCP